MSLKEKKAILRAKASNLKEFFKDFLENTLSPSHSNYNDFMLLQYSYSRVLKDYSLQILTDENYRVYQNRIYYSVIELIDELDENDLNDYNTKNIDYKNLFLEFQKESEQREENLIQMLNMELIPNFYFRLERNYDLADDSFKKIDHVDDLLTEFHLEDQYTDFKDLYSYYSNKVDFDKYKDNLGKRMSVFGKMNYGQKFLINTELSNLYKSMIDKVQVHLMELIEHDFEIEKIKLENKKPSIQDIEKEIDLNLKTGFAGIVILDKEEKLLNRLFEVVKNKDAVVDYIEENYPDDDLE